MVLCQYDGILKNEEEDRMYVEGERKVVLVDRDVMFDMFESQIKRVSGCGSVHIKINYSFKCEAMYVCAHVPG